MKSSLVALLLLVAAAPLLGQPSRIDRERGHLMLEQVAREIRENYYDRRLRGIDLDARFAEARAMIDTAPSIDAIMSSIAHFTLELGDSHTYFVPPERAARVDYGWEMAMVGDSCMVTEVRDNSDARKQGVRPGHVVLAVNGHRPTRHTLWQLDYVFHALRPQAGLRVVMRAPGGEPRQLDLAAAVRPRRRVLDLTGRDGGRDFWELYYEESERIARNRSSYAEVEDALVWRLRTFGATVDDARELIRQARSHRALVLDLRGNGGGAAKTLYWLLGQLYENDIDVAIHVSRGDTTVERAKGAGGDRFAGDLAVLVDSESGSASEVLARTVQRTGRGKVVGDTTAGKVMLGRLYPKRVGAEKVIVYGVSVTVMEVVLPDGTRLEGRGVIPDELVIPTSADLAAQRDPALARALQLAGISITPGAAGTLRFREFKR